MKTAIIVLGISKLDYEGVNKGLATPTQMVWFHLILLVSFQLVNLVECIQN